MPICNCNFVFFRIYSEQPLGFCAYVPPVSYMSEVKPGKPKVKVGTIADRPSYTPVKPQQEKRKPKVGVLVQPVMHSMYKPEKAKPKVRGLIMPNQHTKPKKSKPKISFIKSQTIWSSSEDLYVTVVRLHVLYLACNLKTQFLRAVSKHCYVICLVMCSMHVRLHCQCFPYFSSVEMVQRKAPFQISLNKLKDITMCCIITETLTVIVVQSAPFLPEISQIFRIWLVFILAV